MFYLKHQQVKNKNKLVKYLHGHIIYRIKLASVKKLFYPLT